MLISRKTCSLALAFMVVPCGFGAVVPIDTFSSVFHNAQVSPFDPNPATAFSGIAAPDAIGGSRYMEITRIDGADEDRVRVNNGVFSLVLGTDKGTGLIIWDGNTNSTIDHGLGGIDLSDAGSNSFINMSLRSDLVAPITITIYTGAGASSTYTLMSPGTGFGGTPFTQVHIPFSAFTGSANFASVSAITMFLDGSTDSTAGLDVQVDFFQATPAPEPATFALTGAALLAAGLLRRRRNRDK